MPQPFFLYDDINTVAAGSILTGGAITNEDPAYPAINLLVPDRRVVTKTTATLSGSQIVYTFDLGQVRTFSGFALHNLKPIAAAPVFFPSMSFYAGASTGSLTLLATVAGASLKNARDLVYALPSTYSFQFARAVFSGDSNGFSLGHLAIGTLSQFAYLYAPGSGWEPNTPTAETRTIDMDPVVQVLGTPRRVYTYEWDYIDDVDRAIVERLAVQTDPIGVRDSLGRHFQAVVRPNGTRFRHIASGDPPFIWDSPTLTFEQVP
jgi:hypothetical protein